MTDTPNPCDNDLVKIPQAVLNEAARETTDALLLALIDHRFPPREQDDDQGDAAEAPDAEAS